MLGIDKTHRGTIGAKFPFHDDEAAELLAKLLASKTDVSKMQIFQILTQINNTQRQMIRTPYKIKYNRDLLIDLINGLPVDFKDVILALMETPTKYDTLQLVKAINETGTNESVLIEILCLRTGLELAAIKNEYQMILGKKLETDIATHTSGDLKDILMIVIQKPIITNNDNVNVEKVKEEVKKILSEKKKIDKVAMKNIISALSTYQLNILSAEYATIAGHQIEQDIEKHFNGYAKTALLALIHYSRNSNSFFADLLNKLLKNPSGKRDSDLIRLIISRSEIDLATISEAYMKSYKKKLIEEISTECNGLYRDCLIAIVKGNMQNLILN
uniref:Annexin n=1 Tax=Onchocerca volvulus TaxID=6282 RepID=A0A2K6WLR2_ONCVO